MASLPPSVNLQGGLPACYDQTTLGSCTGNSTAGSVEFDLRAEGITDFVPSRLFIYYNERSEEGTVNEDSGGMLRDAIKTVADLGVCPETLWPYDISQFAVKPSDASYAEALNHRASNYARVPQTENDIKTVLASGKPFVFGFTAYSSFESQEVAQSGILQMPTDSESVVGGHAVLCVGYDDGTRRVLVRNSWGPFWGQNGYFTMPYDYILNPNLACDLWAIYLMSGK
jgi:C1A family cysteine protease